MKKLNLRDIYNLLGWSETLSKEQTLRGHFKIKKRLWVGIHDLLARQKGVLPGAGSCQFG